MLIQHLVQVVFQVHQEQRDNQEQVAHLAHQVLLALLVLQD